MLYTAKTLRGFQLNSRDGEIGKVKEFYFDDQYWAIRYLVADNGDWLTGRQVLISPHALLGVDQSKQDIGIDLTKTQIEDSPSLSSDVPVSRQFEETYNGYYGWPMYWSGPYMWGYYPDLVRNSEPPRPPAADERTWDAHLRSTHDVDGHHVQATDGEMGHVNDFIVDDETWAIRYLVIDTQNWWPGKKVLIAPQWIERVSWSEAKVFVNLPRATIKQAPKFTDDMLVSRDYEAQLYQHYGRTGYWVAESAAEVPAH